MARSPQSPKEESAMSVDRCVGYDVSGGFGTATLRRPEKLNAFNDEMLRELREVLEDVARRDDVRVLILTGEGRAFCGGADLNWFDVEAVGKHRSVHSLANGKDTYAFHLHKVQLRTLVIAAING